MNCENLLLRNDNGKIKRKYLPNSKVALKNNLPVCGGKLFAEWGSVSEYSEDGIYFALKCPVCKGTTEIDFEDIVDNLQRLADKVDLSLTATLA